MEVLRFLRHWCFRPTQSTARHTEPPVPPEIFESLARTQQSYSEISKKLDSTEDRLATAERGAARYQRRLHDATKENERLSMRVKEAEYSIRDAYEKKKPIQALERDHKREILRLQTDHNIQLGQARIDKHRAEAAAKAIGSQSKQAQKTIEDLTLCKHGAVAERDQFYRAKLQAEKETKDWKAKHEKLLEEFNEHKRSARKSYIDSLHEERKSAKEELKAEAERWTQHCEKWKQELKAKYEVATERQHEKLEKQFRQKARIEKQKLDQREELLQQREQTLKQRGIKLKQNTRRFKQSQETRQKKLEEAALRWAEQRNKALEESALLWREQQIAKIIPSAPVQDVTTRETPVPQPAPVKIEMREASTQTESRVEKTIQDAAEKLKSIIELDEKAKGKNAALDQGWLSFNRGEKDPEYEAGPPFAPGQVEGKEPLNLYLDKIREIVCSAIVSRLTRTMQDRTQPSLMRKVVPKMNDLMKTTLKAKETPAWVQQFVDACDVGFSDEEKSKMMKDVEEKGLKIERVYRAVKVQMPESIELAVEKGAKV